MSKNSFSGQSALILDTTQGKQNHNSWYSYSLWFTDTTTRNATIVDTNNNNASTIDTIIYQASGNYTAIHTA